MLFVHQENSHSGGVQSFMVVANMTCCWEELGWHHEWWQQFRCRAFMFPGSGRSEWEAMGGGKMAEWGGEWEEWEGDRVEWGKTRPGILQDALHTSVVWLQWCVYVCEE